MKVIAVAILLVGICLLGVGVYPYIRSTDGQSENRSQASSTVVPVPTTTRSARFSTGIGTCPSETEVSGSSVNFLADCSQGAIIGTLGPRSKATLVHDSGIIHPQVPTAPDFVPGIDEGYILRPEDNPPSWNNRVVVMFTLNNLAQNSRARRRHLK
jgi:hypothetical protein